MKKNKGFTLIELLAIIVILAIIAVITVPIILNTIENSKMGAAKDSAYGYKDAINKFYVSKLAQDKDFEMENKTYTTEELKNLGVSLSGKEPGSNSWIKIINNEITKGCLQFDEYKVDIINKQLSEAIKEECEPPLIQHFDSNNDGVVSNGDFVKIGDDGFYVVGKEDSNVKLLTEFNLDSRSRQTEQYFTNVSFTNSSYWWDSTNKKIYDKYLQDSEGYSYVYKDKDNSDQDVYPLLKTYVNNYKEYLISLGVTNIVNIRLMSYAEAVENGCTTKENSCPLYISNQHYWLGSAYNSYKVWYVNAFRRLNYGSDRTGVRPLIIIPESSL